MRVFNEAEKRIIADKAKFIEKFYQSRSAFDLNKLVEELSLNSQLISKIILSLALIDESFEKILSIQVVANSLVKGIQPITFRYETETGYILNRFIFNTYDLKKDIIESPEDLKRLIQRELAELSSSTEACLMAKVLNSLRIDIDRVTL